VYNRRAVTQNSLLRPQYQTTELKDLHKYLPEIPQLVPLYSPQISPPSQAPKCLKGLISGEIRRYWLQNSPEDFESILSKFIIHLTNRGHHLNDLVPILQQAALKLNSTSTHAPHQPNSNNLYIHQVYHPNGLQRTDIREAYNATLKPILNFEKITVAISCPGNLKDILTKTALIGPQTLNIQRLLAGNQTEHP
jgi:hypothetical protein